MTSYSVTFPVVGFSHTRKVRCLRCGKKFQQTRRFEQSINPWNNKGREQIMTEEREKRDKWLLEPMEHGCESE